MFTTSIDRYIKYRPFNMTPSSYGGGVFFCDVIITSVLLAAQNILHISGNLGEIGVLEARYAVLIHLFSRPEEMTYLVDPYQNEAVIKRNAIHNLETYAGNTDRLVFIPESSIGLDATRLIDKNGAGIRFLSIDGDHCDIAAENDFGIAEKILVNGGIIAADDYNDRNSPGVSTAIGQHFAKHPESRLCPLLVGENKVYFTTKSHHAVYRSFLEKATNIRKDPVHPDVFWLGHQTIIVNTRVFSHEMQLGGEDFPPP